VVHLRAPLATDGPFKFDDNLPHRIDRTLIWRWHALPEKKGGAMNKPSISLMPLQRGGDGRITAFHWVLGYHGAEAQFWILPTDLPRPHAIADFELARLELHRFLEALEVAMDTHRSSLREHVAGGVGK
jgi:hypothetical protein